MDTGASKGSKIVKFLQASSPKDVRITCGGCLAKAEVTATFALETPDYADADKILSTSFIIISDALFQKGL